jgi:NAD-dependent deacetylase
MAEVVRDAREGAQAMQAACAWARRMVFFGGAGVSVASGIPDFRSSDGLYSKKFAYPAEVMLSHDFFYSHPEEFSQFYRENLLALDARPNQAHKKLAQLEDEGTLAAVVTQNIDGLHQMAGSRTVYELHGTVHRNFCERCGATYSARWMHDAPGVPTCEVCGGRVKPDVVLYGEALDEAVMSAAVKAISQADLLVVGGTSLTVWPAAGLIDYFNGRELIIVNRDPTPKDLAANLVIAANIAEVFDF